MPERKRIILEVIVDLDPMPGTFNTVESALSSIQAILLSSIGHYNPVVINPDPEPMLGWEHDLQA